MLMTNITFSKGIGTPIYMSPEVLNKQHYKTPADIYSFALTIYECIKWGEAYPEEAFKFPWKIANFIINGNRLDKPNNMNVDVYELITKLTISHSCGNNSFGYAFPHFIHSYIVIENEYISDGDL